MPQGKFKVSDLVLALFVLVYPVAGVLTGFYLGSDLSGSSSSFVSDKTGSGVNITGDVKVDGYQISLEKHLPDSSDGEVVGKAENGSVRIQTGNRSVKQVYTSCVHEVVGHVKSGYSDSENHETLDDWVYNLQDQVVDPTCLKLLYEMNGGDKDA